MLALIDTGADECAIPASYAPLLGHDLMAGKAKQVNTGNGLTTAYSHTTTIEVGSFTVKNVLIDFMSNLYVVLLGTKSFLNHFILTIDYPRIFFLLQPQQDKVQLFHFWVGQLAIFYLGLIPKY